MRHRHPVLNVLHAMARPMGCLKLQVIFRERATNYRALLRKMTYKDKASYEPSPPCTECTTYNGKERVYRNSRTHKSFDVLQ